MTGFASEAAGADETATGSTKLDLVRRGEAALANQRPRLVVG